MKLFHAPTSPYVRKVMVVAHETGQTDDLELHFSGTTPVAGDPELLSSNPLGKIPALVLEDGSCLFDSRVICEYLAARAGDGGLFPASGAVRWQALTRQALGDGLLDAALLARYEWLMRAEEFRSAEWRAAQLGKVKLALDRIEALAPELEDDLTIGAISLGCALGYLDFRFPELVWRQDRPAAERWFARFGARPSMIATQPRDRAAPAADKSSAQR